MYVANVNGKNGKETKMALKKRNVGKGHKLHWMRAGAIALLQLRGIGTVESSKARDVVFATVDATKFDTEEAQGHFDDVMAIVEMEAGFEVKRRSTAPKVERNGPRLKHLFIHDDQKNPVHNMAWRAGVEVSDPKRAVVGFARFK